MGWLLVLLVGFVFYKVFISKRGGAHLTPVNNLMHEMMEKEATSVVGWVADAYKSSRVKYPECSDREIFKKVLGQRIAFPGGERDCNIVLDRYGTSINGICYYLGLNSQIMKDTMVSRCVQFTEYIDLELENRGFKKPADDIKRSYFKRLGLPEEAVSEKHL